MNTDVETPKPCEHAETFLDACRLICAECGMMLSEKVLAERWSAVGMRKRKVTECPIYNEIPAYVPQHIKDLTVEIYKSVTGTDIFRNTLRRAIVLACLHRASILKHQPICFEEMLEMFNLKTHEANKGVSYVAHNISRTSPFTIPFLNDEIDIESNLASLDLMDEIVPVTKLFNLVKKDSDILNNSQCKSVVCGCVFTWLKFKGVQITLKQFSTKIGMSEMTIVKKYILITKVLFSRIMKTLYSKLLMGCKISSHSRKIKCSDPSALYEHIERLHVFNYTNPDKLSVVDITNGFVFPLDDVDDVTEWHMLLSKKYYTPSGGIMNLSVGLVETSRELKCVFDKYDKLNGQNGQEILSSTVSDYLHQ